MGQDRRFPNGAEFICQVPQQGKHHEADQKGNQRMKAGREGCGKQVDNHGQDDHRHVGQVQYFQPVTPA